MRKIKIFISTTLVAGDVFVRSEILIKTQRPDETFSSQIESGDV